MAKMLLKRDIENAYTNAKSALGAARYLGVNFRTFKKYAQLYGIYKTNRKGKGVKHVRRRGSWGLNEILAGKHPGYDQRRLLHRLIDAGYRNGECALCGFNERRLDGRYPLKINFIDDDHNNMSLDNIEFYCYNCYFLTHGRISADIAADLTRPRRVAPNPQDQMEEDWESMNMSDEELEAIKKEIEEEVDNS